MQADTLNSNPGDEPKASKRVRLTLAGAMALLDEHLDVPQPHGNQRLHYRSVVGMLLWVGWVASGRADVQQMAEALARHERERELENKRRAKKAG